MDGIVGIVIGVIIILQLGWIRMRIDKTNELLQKNRKNEQ